MPVVPEWDWAALADVDVETKRAIDDASNILIDSLLEHRAIVKQVCDPDTPAD